MNTALPRPAAFFIPQLPAAVADETDVEMVIESLDDLFLHADYTEAQEEDARLLFAEARARLFA